MKKIADYIKNNKHSLLLLYWPISTLWYMVVKVLTTESDVLLIHIPLDDKVIFNEWFVIPYVIWYFYIAAVLLITLFTDKKDFLRTCALIYPCMFIPMVFCTVVPNGLDMAMRPDFSALGRDNFAISAVKLLYSVDTPPRNVMPSMHVAVSCTLFASVIKAKFFKGKNILKAILGLLSVSICLATVFIKQHSVLDVFVGVALALAVTAVVYIFERKKEKTK